MHKILTLALTVSALGFAALPAQADNAAADQMLAGVADMMSAARYDGTAHQIRANIKNDPLLVLAYDICQTRALGKTSDQIIEEYAAAPTSLEFYWLRRSVVVVTEQQGYCTAIGADRYIP